MQSQAPALCQRVGHGLAAAVARRRLAPQPALASMRRALPELLNEHPGLVEPLLALLSHPLCAQLIGSADEPTRRRCGQSLLIALNSAAGTSHHAAQCAFLEGLLAGLAAAAAAHDSPRQPAAATPAAAGRASQERSSAVRAPVRPSAEAPSRGRGRWLMLLAWGAMAIAAAGFGAAAWRLLHRHASDQPLAIPAPAGSPSPLRSLPLPQQRADSVAVAAVPAVSCGRLAPRAQELQAPAAPTNYAGRVNHDAAGEPIPATPALIVLHETVIDLPTTINLFQASHDHDAVQVSYHVLIGRDGQRVRVVSDADRAYGAGDSAFEGYTIKTSATNPPSINNIALHVSLESPADGRGDEATHSGYSQAQYQALAAQVLRWQALYRIPNGRVTTHAAVDRSHTRKDPRSFDWDAFWSSHAMLGRRCA
ncbi:MAG: hypothetical protein RLZZ124_65 [Cyanobacteriota bacterium]